MKSSLLIPLVIVTLLASVHAGAGVNKGFAAAEVRDYATAKKEWQKAAEQGDAVAQYIVGVMYDNGRVVLQNFTEVLKWYRLAALPFD